MAGTLEKLRIRAFKTGKLTEPAGAYSVYINPDKYSQSFTICYADVSAQGSSGTSPQFNKIAADTVSFELIFDGTGVVPPPQPGVQTSNVQEQIESFKELVAGYEGDIHSPRFLVLSWGTLFFPCRLARFDLTYTLFKPDGTPLRARANVNFTSYTPPDDLYLAANSTSPDLSHLVTVQAGDTLPLLCHRIYGSSVHYRKIAEINGLVGFRALTIGSRLLFPPLGRIPQ